jgi:hypothetical protein
VGAPPVVSDSQGRFIVVSIRNGPTAEVHAWRLGGPPLAVDQPWSDAHAFELPGCFAGEVQGAAITPDDSVIVVGNDCGAGRGFVAKLRP